MTQEEKQILVKDLNARLPYGVKCKLSANGADISIAEKLETGGLEHFIYGTLGVKPYLRPMLSMTEEEKDEFKNILPFGMTFGITYSNELILYHDEEYDGDYHFSTFTEIEDWLNAHHFDYRGLIEKGLAIEAPEGMYKEK